MDNDHSRDPKFVAIVEKGSLLRGSCMLQKLNMVVVVGRWSLFGDSSNLTVHVVIKLFFLVFQNVFIRTIRIWTVTETTWSPLKRRQLDSALTVVFK